MGVINIGGQELEYLYIKETKIILLSYIYKSYDKNDKAWNYLDSLGQEYYSKDKRLRIHVIMDPDVVSKIDTYRGPVGLSRSRYIEYVIKEHFSGVD